MKMSSRADFIPATPADAAAGRQAATGVALGVGAYLTWGFLPIYLKALAIVPAPQVLAHRILWSLLLVAGLAAVMRRGAALAALLRAPRTIAVLAFTASLIAINWLTYIWAVNAGHVLETSLGYFITPLVNVALGVIVLRERLSRPQLAAVGLAGIGVAVLAVAQGGLPWIALVLAFSFGLYGLLRKMAPVDPLTGLLGETAILAPLCLLYLLWLGSIGVGSFGGSAWIDFLLVLSGLVTAAPLLMFAAASKQLRYATIGLLQYIAPTIQFLLAVLLFGEALTTAHLVTFGFIWFGLALYAADALRATRRG